MPLSGGRGAARVFASIALLIAGALTASCHRAAYLDPDGREIREPPLVANFEGGWIVIDTAQGRPSAILKLEHETPQAGLLLDPGALVLWSGSERGLEPLRRSVGAPVCRTPARRRSGCDSTLDEKRQCPRSSLPREESCVHEIRAVFPLDEMPNEGDQIVLRVGGYIAVLQWGR